MKRSAREFRRGLARGAVKLAFRISNSGKRPYEPVEIGGERFDNMRDSEERWRAIEEVLRRYHVRNVLDVGSAEGWFLRRAAIDCRCFALGIDASDRVLVGELARLHDGIERLALMKARVTAADLLSLPKFDAVICMSVVHHIVRSQGLTSGEEFIRALASCAEKVLIFEMGTAEESSWAASLPEIEQGQEAFVTDLLERCGLRNVQLIAKSAAYHREVPRLLFSAEPTSSASGPAPQQEI